MIQFKALAFAAMLPLLMLDDCGGHVPSSDDKMNQQQENLSNEAASEIGMPNIVNFQEKRMMKQIYELRDTTITTYTYLVTWDGKLRKVCDSVGYGLPYATQYTNPQKVIHYVSSVDQIAAIPQADPNGLFSPADAEGTWVNCFNPETKLTAVVYLEPRVIVSPFPLHLGDQP